MIPLSQRVRILQEDCKTDLLSLVDTRERKEEARELSAIYAPVSLPIPNDAPALSKHVTVTWCELLDRWQKAGAELAVRAASTLHGLQQIRRASGRPRPLSHLARQSSKRASSQWTAGPAHMLLIQSRPPANGSDIRGREYWVKAVSSEPTNQMATVNVIRRQRTSQLRVCLWGRADNLS